MAQTVIDKMEKYVDKCYNMIITLFDKWYESQWTALSNTISILSNNHESLAVTTAAIKSHGSIIKLSNNKSLYEHKRDVENDIEAIENSISLIRDMFISMGISPSASEVYLTHLILKSDNDIQQRNEKIDIANKLIDSWSNYLSHSEIEKSTGSTIEKGCKQYMEIYKLKFYTALNELLPKTQFQSCLSTVASYKLEHQNQEQISQILQAADITQQPTPTTSNKQSFLVKNNNTKRCVKEKLKM